MEAIREEDRGTETMVFEMTSIQLNAELQFCIGNAYEHNGKDRYNVYLVKNGRVHGTIGHYDVPQGESTKDAGGTDFDVMKYKEPSWLIDPSFHLLEKGKQPEKEKERATPKPPPKPKTLFRVIITTTNGDCFYDSVVRSENGNDVEEYNVEKVRALRKRIGEYITTTGRQELLDKYHYSVRFLSGEETLLKDDPYYAKYYKMLADGESRASIIAKIKEELTLKPKLRAKLNVETFEAAGPNDPSENVFSEEEDKVPARHFLHDYFNDEMELNDVDIPEVFLENIEKDQVWASELIIVQMEQMLDVKFLLLTENGSSVEEYNAFDLDTYKAIGANTRFILADYTPNSHFKLIVQGTKKQFLLSEVPAVIKAKFELFKGPEQPVVAAAQDAQQDKLETPAVEVDSSLEEPSGEKYTREKLEKMSNKQLEDILKNEFEGVPVSTLKGKPELIECILNPEQEKCKKKKTKRASLAPVAVVPKVTEAVVEATEPVSDDESQGAEPSGATVTEPSVKPAYTREQLDKMTKGELEKIMMQINPNVAISSIGKQGKQGVIDCILNPEQEKCQSKKAKKGGNYTRKQARQHG